MSENKITPEQLEELQGFVGKLNNAATQIGNLELQKHQIQKIDIVLGIMVLDLKVVYSSLTIQNWLH